MLGKLVSVIITTYNRKDQLSLTLDSILKQTYKNIEIIIIDDYSTDGTKDLIESKLLKLDNRIKYIRCEKNSGLATARNKGILNSNGEYFTFCDDDDLWMPNFIEEFVNVASMYDSEWCFCCSGKYKNFLGTEIYSKFEYEGELKDLIKEGFTPPVASQFYNLSSIKKINGYSTYVKTGVDHDLWIRLAKAGVKIKYIPKILSVPNANFSQSRMTTNYHQRVNGIKNTLLIWKNDLTEIYGNEFYLKFCDAYLLREKLKFLNTFLKDLNIVMVYKIKKDIPFFSFFKILIFSFTKKLLKILIPEIFISKKKKIKVQPTLKI